jgi:hypothetical protein
MATTTKPTEVAPEVAPEVPTKTYPVIGNLEHDGIPYKPGDTIRLTDEQAAVLGGWVIGEAIAS